MMDLTVKTCPAYKIIIEHGCAKSTGAYAKELFPNGGKAAVVCDSNIFPLYAEKIISSLRESGFSVCVCHFPAGEESKRLSSIESMYTCFAENGLTRSDFVVALGGGVTGDMAGFAAATYLRGIKVIQIPTSLLSQIDSSVGGKTGVDLPQGKNLVGAFHQPSLVLIDPDTLTTLPHCFFSDGMGEAIKYGCIKSRELFNMIKNTDINNNIEKMIFECVNIKRDVVEKDEFDNGERMLLNFGHTFGHALEKLYNYKRLSHGAAVGVGMVAMAKCGEAAGLTEPGTADEISVALKKYGLPISDNMDIEKIAATTVLDKKSRGGIINLIMLKKIGESFIYKVNHAELLDLMRAVK